MNEETFKPLDENIKIKPAIVNLPEVKKEEEQPKIYENTINNLPTWNIEPPIEIKRGE